MTIKRVSMLASMAFAAAVFAVPVAALAAEDGTLYDIDTGHTVTAGEELELTGEAEFTAFGTGIRCVVHAPVEADSASMLTIKAYTITPETCVGFGFYEGCEVVEPETTTPWDVTVTKLDFDILGMETVTGYGGVECPFTFSGFEYAEVTATPLNEDTEPAVATEPIYGISLEGEGEHCNDFGCLSVETHGHLQIGGGDAGTYAFEH